MSRTPEPYLPALQEIDAPLEEKIVLIEWLQVLAHEAYDRALENLGPVEKQAHPGDFDGSNQPKLIDCKNEKLRTRFNKSE